jgi:prophage regulatory protein
MAKLIRLGAVKDLTGLSRSSIYAHPDFPRPVKIGAGGRAVAWVESEIRDWVEARIKERGLA